MHKVMVVIVVFVSVLLYAPLAIPLKAGNDFVLYMPAVLAGSQNGVPGTGNPAGSCFVPNEARLEDVSSPDHVIGNGSPQSCTSEAVTAAIALGGVITFNCGPLPVTIVMKKTAKIVNNTGPGIVIDGGGKVTLSGNDAHRILYMNTCDPDQVWTTSHCQNQDHPQLTVQNLTFIHGNSKAETQYDGGGAIYNDGNTFTLSLCGTKIEKNSANEGGGAIFFVSNDRSGSLVIKDSFLSDNPSGGFETPGYPGIFYLGKGNPTVINSIIE
jgi:hypothetical protein